MKIAKVVTAAGPRMALLSHDGSDTIATPLGSARLDELLADADWPRHVAADDRLDTLRNPKIMRLSDETTRVFCVGHNYRHHIQEMGREIPDFPTVFAKIPSATIGPYDPISLSGSTAFDWEAELAVVVGAPLHHATETEAAQAIAGYTLMNDVTARDWQHRTSQWFLGKNFDATTPVGPALVTPEDLPHDDQGNVDVEILCQVNGGVRQRARTSDLVFTVTRLLAYLSSVLALRVGDIIATGTPGGVGAAANPPQFLQDGDTVVVSAAGIGHCSNVCRVAHPLPKHSPPMDTAGRLR